MPMFDMHMILTIVSIALVGGLIGLDRTAVGQFMISQPIFASGFLSRDNLTMDSRSGFAGELGIDNRAASTRWTHLFSDNVFSTFNLSWSRYENGFTADASGFTTEAGNGIQDYTLKGSVEWFAGSDLTVKAGMEASHYIFTFRINYTGEPNEKSAKGTNEGGVVNLEVPDETYSAFAQANYRFTPLFSVQTGLRANHYAMRNLTTFDPRIAVRYQLDPDIAVKAAWGLYHQYFRLASMPDFTFFDTWFPTDATVAQATTLLDVLQVGLDHDRAPSLTVKGCPGEAVRLRSGWGPRFSTPGGWVSAAPRG